MIINQRGTTAAYHPDAEPDRVPAQKIIHIVMTILGKGASAKKDDDAKGKQGKHGEEQDVGAFTMHQTFSSSRFLQTHGTPMGATAALRASAFGFALVSQAIGLQKTAS